MSEPLPEIERALTQVGAAWDDARSERTLAGARDKRVRRQRRQRLSAAAAAIGLLATGAGFAALQAFGPPPSGQTERVLTLEDGSRALLLDDTARVVVSEVAPNSVVVALPQGRARFDVVPRPERSFRVRCGEVEVQVLGTSFELIRAGARTHVSVLRGHVAVHWSAGSAELRAGESGWFPRGEVARDSEAGAEARALPRAG